ncbi:hypothetical protein [Mycoplasmopsis cricetuli]|uniref:hypothetical protein n=1 Tax=Mycoplasmopsis cricetuli TaxID=171283 RepID=UPI00046EB211|nr:hypothetical protein [Mycoplasmopsis cricetuli]
MKKNFFLKSSFVFSFLIFLFASSLGAITLTYTLTLRKKFNSFEQLNYDSDNKFPEVSKENLLSNNLLSNEEKEKYQKKFIQIKIGDGDASAKKAEEKYQQLIQELSYLIQLRKKELKT